MLEHYQLLYVNQHDWLDIELALFTEVKCSQKKREGRQEIIKEGRREGGKEGIREGRKELRGKKK